MHRFLALFSLGYCTPCNTAPPPLLRPPQFSMNHLGGMVFAHITKSSAFNATDLALLSKYQIVQFDKSQDVTDMPWSTLEDRFIAAARQIKSVNANATTLIYFNGLIDFPDFERLSNATAAQPSLLLHNTKGKPVQTLAPHGTFDMRQKAMRELFVSDAKYGVESGVFDGVFIDRANYAVRALIQMKYGTAAQQKHLKSLGWDEPTLQTLVPAQTQLLADLTKALGPQSIVLAKETGGGAPFTDWMVANAAMTSDTFCSSYLPKGGTAQPASYTRNVSCAAWSPPVRGHVPLHGGSIWDGQNKTSFAACEKSCCHNSTCAAVLYNTEIKKCLQLPEPYTTDFTCMNGTGVEWIANKREPGSTTCTFKPPSPPHPNASSVWNASQCREDMAAVAAAVARRQLTQSHGMGPMDDAVQRQFTMACFLIAAGNYSFFSYAGWARGEAWSLAGTRWWPEYDRPLGLPLDPPMMPSGAGGNMQYARRFGSGTVVNLDLLAHTASISWGQQA
jgi:hypothetical protein